MTRTRMTGPATLVAGLVIAAVVGPAAAPTAAFGVTSWVVQVATGSVGVAQAESAVPPTGVSATCTSPTTAKTITVTWNAIAHATYTVWQSTTSATTGYTQVATGLTATTWTSGKQNVGRTYWYEVSATIGGVWTTANSTATAPLTINNKAPFC